MARNYGCLILFIGMATLTLAAILIITSTDLWGHTSHEYGHIPSGWRYTFDNQPVDSNHDHLSRKSTSGTNVDEWIADNLDRFLTGDYADYTWRYTHISGNAYDFYLVAPTTPPSTPLTPIAEKVVTVAKAVQPKPARVWRMVLVLTEVHIENQRIKKIKACSNYPNFHVDGTLRYKHGSSYREIEVESRIYQKPIWKDGAWTETCKVIQTDIPVTEILLIASGGWGDIFDVALAGGVWYRKYRRREDRFTYPYHDVVDGRKAEAWYQVPAAPSTPHKRKITGMWASLKRSQK